MPTDGSLALRLRIVQDGRAYAGGRGDAAVVHADDGAGRVRHRPSGGELAVGGHEHHADVVAYRGAGRPEATAAIERIVDIFAAEIGLDPADVRRMNFVAPTGSRSRRRPARTYDCG